MPIKRLSQSSLLTFEKYSSMLAGNTAYIPPATGYEWLETQVLPSAQSTVTFSNLNTNYGSTYQHLQIRAMVRSSRSDTDSIYYIRFNGDSTSGNYRAHFLRSTGSAISSESLTTSYPNGIIVYGGLTANTATANAFGADIIDIFNPFDTTKNTTTRGLVGQVAGINRIALESGLWINTAAVTSISLVDVFGNFVQNSRFSLYGMRSA